MNRQLLAGGELLEFVAEPGAKGQLVTLGRKLARAGVCLAIASASEMVKGWIIGSVAAHAPLILKVLVIAAVI